MWPVSKKITISIAFIHNYQNKYVLICKVEAYVATSAPEKRI